MKFFLDSAKTDEIEYALDMWDIDGVTTNPRHVLVSGKPFLKVIAEIGEIFAGTDKPISVEVNPHLDDWNEMVKEGKKLAAMSPNFIIKLPATEPGFKAVYELASDGIKSNLTLAFSPAQALMAMRMGASFVSPFIGWKEANGEEITHFIDEVTAIRNNFGFETEIIVAAARNARQIVNSAVSGADIVTAGMPVFKDAFDHPYTGVGLGKFQSFWDETPYE
ncbi:MAG: transaldolase family protein [Acidimicrobiia bacterium]|nr:transaldolase family protein [Acidimicrobiia bacterium]